MVKKKYISISEVEASPIQRLSTGEFELDWLYGGSLGEDNLHRWGMPLGKISIWVGEGGVGKSRLAIDIARKNVLGGNSVLYFQNEVDLPALADWVIGSEKLYNFYCSETTSLPEQLAIIEGLEPTLIFVDSINLIKEFGSGVESNIKEIMDEFREIIKKTNSHVVFLCQLTKDGSAKGSTALTHLSDITIILTNENNDFKVAIGNKNRYGRTGSQFYGIWKHTREGVRCLTNNRRKDKNYINDFDISPLTSLVEDTLPSVPPLKKQYSEAVVEAVKFWEQIEEEDKKNKEKEEKFKNSFLGKITSSIKNDPILKWLIK